MNIENNNHVNARTYQPNNHTSNTLHNLYFSDLLGSKEDINQKQSTSSCDCNNDKKLCECDSDKETSEKSEVEKSSEKISSCFECPHKDECGHHMNGGFDVAAMNSRLTSTGASSDFKSESSNVQTNPDIMAESLLDYTNAYAYMKKKIVNIEND